MNFSELLNKAAVSVGLELNDRQLKQFADYYELLIAWNSKINLTAITQPNDVAIKHMIDSLLCYDRAVFSKCARVIDVGTGAGFPGIPLKIYQPNLQLTLLDSLNKRLVYLREVIDKLGLTSVNLIHARAEDAGNNKAFRQQFDVAVSRAVARLNVLGELCLPFVRNGGYFVALKGKDAAIELSEATKAIEVLGGKTLVSKQVYLPDCSDARFIIVIQKQKSTPSNYPRRPAIIEKNSL